MLAEGDADPLRGLQKFTSVKVCQTLAKQCTLEANRCFTSCQNEPPLSSKPFRVLAMGEATRREWSTPWAAQLHMSMHIRCLWRITARVMTIFAGPGSQINLFCCILRIWETTSAVFSNVCAGAPSEIVYLHQAKIKQKPLDIERQGQTQENTRIR